MLRFPPYRVNYKIGDGRQTSKARMSYEEIYEPIEVITFFEQGKLHPLRFRWKGEVYKITKVNSFWSVQQGLGRECHFSVTTNSPDCFELTFDTANFDWQLARVYLEG